MVSDACRQQEEAMQEVDERLFVGNDSACEAVSGRDGWAVVHACKEPCHRRALGYTGRGAPNEHPAYLFARRDNDIMLNMIDAERAEFFAKDMIDAALAHIAEMHGRGLQVLIHCNMGMSRSASLALLYLARQGHLSNTTLALAERDFRERYDVYRPAQGIRDFLDDHWRAYMGAGVSW